MFVLRRVLLLLLLLLAALSCSAEMTNGTCAAQNKRLPTSDLDKIFGGWALVWAAAHNSSYAELLVNLSSSHLELKLHDDNKTIMLNERNLYGQNVCNKFFANATVTSEPLSSMLTLQIVAAVEEIQGVQSVYNDSAQVFFYQSCTDCLLMSYRSEKGQGFMLSYRREGKHNDLAELRASKDEGVHLAECLDFKIQAEFRCDGVTGFCQKEKLADVAS